MILDYNIEDSLNTVRVKPLVALSTDCDRDLRSGHAIKK